HRGLDAALVQFLDDLLAPTAAEALLCQVITATDQSADKKNDRESQKGAQNPHPHGVTDTSAVQSRSGRLTQQLGWHARLLRVAVVNSSAPGIGWLDDDLGSSVD